MTTKSFIVIKDKAQVLTNKTIDADSNVISNIEADNFKTVTSSDEDKVFVVKSDGAFELNYNKEFHEVAALPATGNSRFLYYLNTADATHKVGLYVYSNSAYVNVGSSSVEVVDTLPATGKTDTLYVLKDDSTVSLLGRYSIADSYTSTYEIREGGIWDSATSTYISYQTVEDAFRTTGMPEYLVSNPTDGEMVRYRYRGNTVCGYSTPSISARGMTTYVYSDNQWVKSLGLQEVDGVTVSLTSAGKVEVKDYGLSVSKLRTDAVSTAIPSTSTVDTKLTTEKAVGDYSVAKQYTSAEDNYVARVDPTDHMLKPMIKLSDVQVVDTLPATGTENTLYALKLTSTVLHKYAIASSYSGDYEIVAGGIKDVNAGSIRYTYGAVENQFASGTPDYLEEDDTAGTLIRLTYDGKNRCQYSGTALPTGTKPYVYYDSAFVYVGEIADMSGYLPLYGGTLTGKLICNNRYDTAIEGSEGDDLLITAGCEDFSTTIYGGTTSVTGASLALDGADNANTDGGFTLTACKDSSHKAELKGRYDGYLTWKNRNVSTTGYFLGNATATAHSVSGYTLSGSWLLNVMGNTAVISRHTSDYKIQVNGIEMSSGDTFYLGDYPVFIESVGGTAPNYLVGLAVTGLTVGDYIQIALTGL